MAFMLTQIIGNLVADPEVRMSPSGQKITTFRMACNTKRQGKEKTTWWRITIFGDRFDRMIPHLKKGSLLFVSGSLNPPEVYQTRDGQHAASLEIIAEFMSFLPMRQDRGEQQQEMPKQEQANGFNQPAFAANAQFSGMNQGEAPTQNFADDDIPF